MEEDAGGVPPSAEPGLAWSGPEEIAGEVTGRAALGIILCDSPARKTRLLGMIAEMAPGPVSYVDTDLLYAGCVGSGLCKRRARTTVLCPDRDTWNRDLAGVISAASSPSPPGERMTVIIDSLNGVYELSGGSDAARAANAHIMLLGSLASRSGSSVVVGAVAKRRQWRPSFRDGGGAERKPDNPNPGAAAASAGEWITNPGGRQIPKMASTYLLGGTYRDPSIARLRQ